MIEEPKIQRRKATALFYALEQGLARVLKSRAASSAELPSEICALLQGRARSQGTDPEDLNALVEQMYFGEIAEAIALVKGCSEAERLAAAQILELTNRLAIHEIRLAVSHQNRPWKLPYLPQLEALCLSEPVTAGLRLDEVAEAYACIKLGKFEVPEGDWLSKIRRPAIQNNLDEYIRGNGLGSFVGRSEERRKIRKQLLSLRTNTVSIIGPGGIGKTAFALKSLSDLAQDPDTPNRFDRILFCTGKRQRLTAGGAIDQTPDFNSLEELRLSIAISLGTDSFDECVSAFNELRLLLCVDNLEDLLGAHPAALEEFQDQLPVPWVLLVTSRIFVPSQFAITLEALKPSDLEKIACERLASYGVSDVPGTARKLAEAADTPLALIVATDAVAFGGSSISHALGKAKGLTAEFAFNSLLELQKIESLRVLDAIQVANELAGQHDLAVVLDTSLATIGELLVALRQTNLILPVSKSDEEPIKLSPVIKDLLARRSVSDLRRDDIYGKWHTLQSESKLLDDVVDDGLPTREGRQPARLQLLRIRERIGRIDSAPTDVLSHIEHSIRFFEDQFGQTANSKWLLAELAKRQPDRRHLVERHLEESIELDDTNWKLRWQLAQLKFSQGDNLSCSRLLNPIISNLDDDRSGISLRTRSEIFIKYFTSRLFYECDRVARGGAIDRKRFEKLHDEVDAIRDPGLELNRRMTRVSILRRSVERGATLELHISTLARALQIIVETFEESGRVIGWWCPEVTAIIGQFAFIAKYNEQLAASFPAEISVLRAFCGRWGQELLLVSRTAPELTKHLKFLSSKVNEGSAGDGAEGSHTLSAGKSDLPGWDAREAEELIKLGYVATVIYSPPHDRAFCFSKDIDGNKFYINRNESDCSEDRFRALRHGETILVLPGTQSAMGRATPALSAVMADSV